MATFVFLCFAEFLKFPTIESMGLFHNIFFKDQLYAEIEHGWNLGCSKKEDWRRMKLIGSYRAHSNLPNKAFFFSIPYATGNCKGLDE